MIERSVCLSYWHIEEDNKKTPRFRYKAIKEYIETKCPNKKFVIITLSGASQRGKSTFAKILTGVDHRIGIGTRPITDKSSIAYAGTIADLQKKFDFTVPETVDPSLGVFIADTEGINSTTNNEEISNVVLPLFSLSNRIVFFINEEPDNCIGDFLSVCKILQCNKEKGTSKREKERIAQFFDEQLLIYVKGAPKSMYHDEINEKSLNSAIDIVNNTNDFTNKKFFDDEKIHPTFVPGGPYKQPIMTIDDVRRIKQEIKEEKDKEKDKEKEIKEEKSQMRSDDEYVENTSCWGLEVGSYHPLFLKHFLTEIFKLNDILIMSTADDFINNLSSFVTNVAKNKLVLSLFRRKTISARMIEQKISDLIDETQKIFSLMIEDNKYYCKKIDGFKQNLLDILNSYIREEGITDQDCIQAGTQKFINNFEMQRQMAESVINGNHRLSKLMKEARTVKDRAIIALQTLDENAVNIFNGVINYILTQFSDKTCSLKKYAHHIDFKIKEAENTMKRQLTMSANALNENVTSNIQSDFNSIISIMNMYQEWGLIRQWGLISWIIRKIKDEKGSELFSLGHRVIARKFKNSDKFCDITILERRYKAKFRHEFVDINQQEIKELEQNIESILARRNFKDLN